MRLTNPRKEHMNQIDQKHLPGTSVPRTATRLAEATVAFSPDEVDTIIASLDARLERGERIFKTSGVVDPDWSKTAVEVYELLDRLETIRSSSTKAIDAWRGGTAQ